MQNIVTLNQNDLWRMLADMSSSTSEVRIQTSEYGLIYSVDYGMWTPPTGEADAHRAVARRASDGEIRALLDEDGPELVEPCDHAAAGSWITPGGAIYCRGCGAPADE